MRAEIAFRELDYIDYISSYHTYHIIPIVTAMMTQILTFFIVKFLTIRFSQIFDHCDVNEPVPSNVHRYTAL